jgi:hypothetical protein
MYETYLNKARALMETDAGVDDWMMLWNEVTERYGRYSALAGCKVDTEKSISIMDKITAQIEKEFK